MIVRPAISEDFDDIVLLYHQLNPDDPYIKDGSDREVYDIILSSDWLDIYVLEFEGKIVATAYLNVIPNITRNVRSYAIIENVVTDENYRGQGYGKHLLKEILKVVWQKNCHKAILQTGSKKESTHAFYEACGFIKGERFAFVACPDSK